MAHYDPDQQSEIADRSGGDNKGQSEGDPPEVSRDNQHSDRQIDTAQPRNSPHGQPDRDSGRRPTPTSDLSHDEVHQDTIRSTRRRKRASPITIPAQEYTLGSNPRTDSLITHFFDGPWWLRETGNKKAAIESPTNPQSSQSGFLQLPVRVRQRIYSFAIQTQPEPCRHQWRFGDYCTHRFEDDHERQVRCSINLLLINKALCEEVLSFLCNRYNCRTKLSFRNLKGRTLFYYEAGYLGFSNISFERQKDLEYPPMSAYRNWKLDISLDDTNRAPALDDLVHALLSYLSTIRGHNLKTLHIKLTAHAHAYDGANLPSSAFDTMEGCLSRLVYDLRGLHNLTEVENKTVEIDFGKLGRSSWLWYHPVFQNQTVVMDMSGNVGRVVSTQKTDRPIHISSTCEGCKPAQRAASVISGLDPEEAMEMFSFALDSDTFSSELGTKSILKTVFPEVALAKDEQGWLWLYYQSSVEDSRFTGQGVKLT